MEGEIRWILQNSSKDDAKERAASVIHMPSSVNATGLVQGYLISCFSFIAEPAVGKSQCHFWSLNSDLQGLADKICAKHSHSCLILATNPYM